MEFLLGTLLQMVIEEGSVERLKGKSGKKKKKRKKERTKRSQSDGMVPRRRRSLSEKVEYRSVFARGAPR